MPRKGLLDVTLMGVDIFTHFYQKFIKKYS